jgi:hypothetical protein
MFRILWDPSSGSTEPYLTEITRACEPQRVISVKYGSVLPDDGSHRIRNMLERLLVLYVLNFYTT